MTDLDPAGLLERVANRVPESAPPIADVLAAGRRSRRRRALVLIGAAAAGVIVTTGTVAVVTRPGENTSTAGPANRGPDPTPPPGMSFNDALAWAQSLPRGPDAQVAYIDGHTLVAGTSRVDLGKRAGGELLGTLDGGWFARRWTVEERNGNEIGTRIGVLTPGGAFRAFDRLERAPGSNGGWAVSPDLSQVAYDGRLVDVASGRVSDVVFPGGVGYIWAWTDLGIEYDTRGDPSVPMLWNPTSGGVRSFPEADGFAGPDLLESYGNDCSSITRLEAGNITTPFGERCEHDGALAAATSPNGRIVSSDGRVVDPSGRELANLDIPVPPPTDGTINPRGIDWFWEGDDALLFTLRSGFADPRWITVRCRLGSDATTQVRCDQTPSAITSPEWAVQQLP